MSVRRHLERLVLEKAPGPVPSFNVFDIVKVLETIADAGLIGRGKISEKLRLGEGATRTLLARLSDAKLITTSKSGCALTGKGKRLWEEFSAIMPQKVELQENELTFAPYNVAVLVKNRVQKVEKGLEQRDAAVRAGARGAMTLLLKGNRLVLPTISQNLASDYPKAFSQIAKLRNLEENDVVIICGADGRKEAEYGALAAAWTII